MILHHPLSPFITWKASRVRIVAVRPRRPQRPRQDIFTQPSWHGKGLWGCAFETNALITDVATKNNQKHVYHMFTRWFEVSGSDIVSRNAIRSPISGTLSKAESFCNAVLAAFSTAWFPGYLAELENGQLNPSAKDLRSTDWRSLMYHHNLFFQHKVFKGIFLKQKLI